MVTSLSSIYNRANNPGVGIMVLKKAMDTSEGQSDLLQSMMNSITEATKVMERSVSPHLGGNIDIRI